MSDDRIRPDRNEASLAPSVPPAFCRRGLTREGRFISKSVNWLNIRTEKLRSPDVVKASHVALATWLRVITYCVEQENGGRIVGGADWNDRMWLMTCGVDAIEVAGASPLLRREGADILVSMYPSEKEKEVRKNRTSSAKGGRSISEAKREAVRINGTKGGRPKNLSGSAVENLTEGNGIGKEVEGNGKVNGKPTMDGFDEFWTAYPKKVAKAEAEKSWMKHACCRSVDAIMKAVEAAKRSAGWIKDKGEFIPHPTTWLNQKRWQDELLSSARPPTSTQADPDAWREFLSQCAPPMEYRKHDQAPQWLREEFKEWNSK